MIKAPQYRWLRMGQSEDRQCFFNTTAPQYRWLCMGQLDKSEIATAPQYRWLRMGQSDQ